jgi:ubiquinone/menaquinone biosynthesis C-methylase UbiE
MVGFYNDNVVPRIINFCCGMKPREEVRARVCGGVSGKVVEIGFGSGLNVPHYPAAVMEVAAVEPSDTGWKMAGKRLAASSAAVTRSGLDGESLPFGDDSFDAAISTWTMCTIPDVDAALAELRRVLRPGGTLHFVEHGRSPDPKVYRTQQRFEPMQRRLFGGCHLTRPIDELIKRAGFTITELDTFYEKATPKMAGWDYLGVAVSP